MTAMKKMIITASLMLLSTTSMSADEYLGRIGSNRFCGDCTANPFAAINNPFNPNSPNNRFGPYGSRFSPYSGRNPFSVDGPKIYGTAPSERTYDDYGGDDEMELVYSNKQTIASKSNQPETAYNINGIMPYKINRFPMECFKLIPAWSINKRDNKCRDIM